MHLQKAVLVVFFEHGDVLFPGGVTLADQVLSILRQALQSQVLRFKLRRVDLRVEELTGHWVDTPGLQFVNGLVNSLVEHADKRGVDAHRFEKVDLGLGLGEAVKDPAINATITLTDSVLNQAQDELVRDRLALLLSFLQLDLDGRVPFGLSLEDLLWAHVDKTEIVSNFLSLRGATGAWRSDKKNLRGAAGSAITVTD